MKTSCLLLLLLAVCYTEAARKCCAKAKNPTRKVCYRNLDKFEDDPEPTLTLGCENPCAPLVAYCDVTSCTECADATCYNDYCDCRARFFLGDREVNCTVEAN